MHDDQFALMQELVAAQQKGTPVVLATVIRARGSVPRHAGAKMLVYEDGHFSGTIGGGEMEARVLAAAQEALASGETRLVPYSLVDPQRGDPGVCGGEVEIYVEPYLPPATVYVIGAGHVGRAVAHLAHWLGYRVIVSDDREELATPQHIPDADIYLAGSIPAALEQQPLTRSTFVVLVTRNVLIDREILPTILASPAPYVGVIGSRRRWQHTKELLHEDGVNETLFEQVHAPIGLELGAETPEEIAVSIMAEIIMQRRGGHGRAMSQPASG
ncbi:MAG: XdhC family protein, partial [Anaerolineae bacterium]|nr:XdhC family protein [Anaerolineae bacterium]